MMPQPEAGPAGRTWTRDELELLEFTPDAIVVVDPDGAIVFANTQTEKLFGYRRAELMGAEVEVLIPDAFRKHHHRHRTAYQTHPHVRTMGAGLDLLGLRKDGVEIPVDISLSPALTDAGPVVIAAVRDISDRKRIEHELRAANKRLRRDVEAAARLQQSLLPAREAPLDGINFAWLFEPCDRLAGDSFNYFRIDDQHVGIYLLDVSGHGVVAALQSVALTRVLATAPWQATVLRSIESPVTVVHELNRHFPIDPDTWQYFTFLCAIVDIPRREIRYVTAGHPGPVLVPTNGPPRTLEACGFPIGLFADADYEEFVIPLGQGDRVYFCSDGITDAMNADEEIFGLDRFLTLLDTTHDQTLEASVDRVGAGVMAWSGASRPQDDLSVLALEITT